MPTNLARVAVARQSESLVRESSPRATSVAQAEAEVELLLTFIRQSMNELGWNDESLAAAMGYSDASYPGKVLKGEKPLSAAFLVALPDDIESLFAQKWAEHRGAVVVAPLIGRAAVEALVAGLVGVLVPQLPAKAGPALKVNLDARGKAAAR
jgi:hypothetical protein